MLKQYNFRLEDKMVQDAYDIAEAYNTSVTELVREGLSKIIEERKNDIYYRLTQNIDKCDKKESKEIIDALNALTDDDLEIVETEVVSIGRKK